jgi:hypothetical protein
MNLQGRDLAQGLTGADVTELQNELIKLGFAVPADERQTATFGQGTLIAVREFQTKQGLAVTGAVDATTAAKLSEIIILNTYTVSGTVTSPVSAGVGGLTVQLVAKNVGQDTLLTSSSTDPQGAYRLSAVSPLAKPALQIRVFAGNSFLAASVVVYNAPPTVTIDVTLPADAIGLPSEYETLAGTISGLIPSGARLGTLTENDQQQDITFLANYSGFDARLVAMLAQADHLNATSVPPLGPAPAPPTPTPLPTPPAAPTTGPLPAPFFYVLRRAGFPANPDSLFQASPKAVQAVWEQAIKQGVIPQSLSGEIAAAVQTFTTLSAFHTLIAKPPVGISNLQQMLQASVPNITWQQQQQFAQIYAQYRDDMATFWSEVEKSFGAPTAVQLRFDGQLYGFALNNITLVSALKSAEHQNPLTSMLDLATRGYYVWSKWVPLIGDSVPSEIPGETPDEQRNNYAQLLAAQVRLAYPTAVVADLVAKGAFPLSSQAAQNRIAPADVASFLTANQGKFEIGIEPIKAYLARANLTATPAPVADEIMRLQRVYQSAPDDDTMAVLLQHNLHSAYEITRYDLSGFLRAFQAKLGGKEMAAKIHARAKQIHGATLNIAVSYLGTSVAPPIGGSSPIMRLNAPAPDSANSIIAYPTLEGLFGSLDFCSCQECRSILSPAAYLVDLLHYLDHPSPAPGYQNPQSVLFQRRPDLQYLPLTCENTNTPLPYIDVVNETLEYFVANKQALTGYQGHDTGDSISSGELMATPQYVNDAAYTTLQSVFFPPPLPFDRPLELLRLQIQKIGVALSDAMAALRASDAIDRISPTDYGWRDILMETLGISRDEFLLFTDSTKVDLGGLYGYADQPSALTALQTMSLQDFSRRTGVRYDDLFSILETQFINPNAILIPRLERLKLPFKTLQALRNNQLSAIDFESLLPPSLDAREYGGTAPTDLDAVVNWAIDPANNNKNYMRIMSIITITNPNPVSPVDQCSATSLQFRYSNPDPPNELTVTDFVKLIRFIRLWRKLGLSIERTDELLSALFPPSDMPSGTNDAANLQLLDQGFVTFLSRAGFLFQIKSRFNLTADADLSQILACWAPIGTVGNNALYKKMLGTPAVLQAPGAQSTTIAGPVSAGDVLTTTINGVKIRYAVQASDVQATNTNTIATIAGKIVAAINTTSAIDQTTGLPLNSRIYADLSSRPGVVVIRAGFTLACSVPAGATETYTAGGASPLHRTATVGGNAITPGDVLTTTINNVPIPCKIAASDTPTTIADRIASAINSSVAQDPFSGLPVNTLVLATSASGVITINATNSGAPFALACSYAPSDAGSYDAGPFSPPRWTATIGGTAAQAGDTLITTINGVALPYAATASDANITILASSIAAMINTSTVTDPASTLPMNNLVAASAAARVITLTARDPTTPFTLACSVSHGAETYTPSGPLPASQSATVGGTFAANRVLLTTINGIGISYATIAGDTPASVAANIAAAINATKTVDPTANLPLKDLVSAAAGPTVTSGGRTSCSMVVTAKDATTTFTITVSLTAGSYTAGRLSSPFADDGYGNFLQDSSQTLFGHESVLCAACSLTGTEFASIAKELNFDANTALSLPNVSAIFRYGWLAHTLHMSVPEFLLLRRFSVLDPFAPLDPGSPLVTEPPAVRFIRLVQALAASELKREQALYLMWNQDISGRSAPAIRDITGLARTLRSDFAAVEAQFRLGADPDGTIARGLMALVYGNPAADFFFGLLNNTLATSVAYAHPQPTLAQSIIDASGGRLSYNDLQKQLTFAGVLDNGTQAAINQAIIVNTNDNSDNIQPGDATFTPASMANITSGTVLVIDSGSAQETVTVTKTTATTFSAIASKSHNGTATPFPIISYPQLSTAIANLVAASQRVINPFFAAYKELLPLFTAFVGSSDPVQKKRNRLLEHFLPTLKQKRKLEQALAAITATAGVHSSFATTLLQDPAIMYSAGEVTAAAVTDLIAIEGQGLSAQFYLTNTMGPNPDLSFDAVPLAYAQTATIGGAVQVNDVLTTIINHVAITYTVKATDTLATIAGNMAAAINATPTINQVISALVSPANSNVIEITGIDPSGANSSFSLTCSVSPGARETYSSGSQLPGGQGAGPVAGVWSGYISAPQDGFYDIAVATDAGANVSLSVGGVVVPVAPSGNVWGNQQPISLIAGALTPILLTVTSIKYGLSVSWKSLGRGWQVIDGQYLYSNTLVDRLRDTYLRFLKATSLASALSLTANELAWLSTATINTTDTHDKFAPGSNTFTPLSMTNIKKGSTLVIDVGSAQETVTVTATTATTFTTITTKPHDGTVTPFPIVNANLPNVGQGWLDFLAASQDPDSATAASLRDVLMSLLNYARVKQVLSPNDERLLGVLQNPAATMPNGASALLSLTRWDQNSLNALLKRFNLQLADLSSVENFCRVYDAYAFVKTCRVSAPVLISVATNAPSAATVAALQSALRALYAEPDWLTVVWPINDVMRIRQRDALVAYILQQLGDKPETADINTPDKLFEYFLIDVETQPPVETSRIRLALSSVQLFIERILRNLEPQVSASDIDGSLWPWMKRYRVWQANREVFLWPENWLYPELRDDQSPFFRETMSALLQSDITDDAAANAYLDYLTKLEEVAKLEPCGLYYVGATGDSNEISHVVARTAGAHRKYYFRKLENASWTPWTEVKIDCEDMPLTPIVWNGRLFLFWLKVIKQLPQDGSRVGSFLPGSGKIADLDAGTVKTGVQAAAAPTNQPVEVRAVLCWSEFYNGKWQPTKTSDINRPTSFGSFPVTGDGAFDLYRPSMRIVPRELAEFPDSLVLGIEATSAGFILYNTHSLPVRFEDEPGIALSFARAGPRSIRLLMPESSSKGGSSPASFGIQYATYRGGLSPILFQYTNNILQFSLAPRYVEAQPGSANAWDTPFFFEDRRNLFYVTTTETAPTIQDFQGFGMLSNSPSLQSPVVNIPPLVFQQQPKPPVKGDPVLTRDRDGGPMTVQGYLTESTTIRVGIGSTALIPYNGRQIGLSGSAPASDSFTTGRREREA